MLDWITGIWSKPLASWTLIDMFGLIALFVGSVIGLVVAFVVLVRTTHTLRYGAPVKRKFDIDELRKSLGYDAPDEKK